MPLNALPTPSTPTHPLFNSKTDSLPTLDELVQLETELRTLRDEAAARKDKAESGLHAMDVIWRKAKEKTRGLARERDARSKDNDRIRAIKLKRETGTPTPDVEDFDTKFGSHPSSNGTASKGLGNGARHLAHTSSTYKKSKLAATKKRKHADSDGETSDHGAAVHSHKSKANVSSKLAGSSQANPRVAEDFTLPNREIVPPKPNLAALSIFPYLHQTPASSSTQPDTREDVYAARSAMDSNPLSVMDDFSAARQPPNQTTITTFWTAADPWVKPLGLEDLANLELEGDDIQPYEFVPLGRHYLDRWDDEDTQAFADELGAPSTSNLSALPSSAVASALNVDPHQPWDPASIGPEDLVRDERSMGIVRARLLAAFLPVPGGVTIGKEDGGGEGDEREKERRTGTGTAGMMGVLEFPDLEERIRAEASAIGLLGDDDSEPIIPADDEIASSLRRLQRILRAQSTLNSIRKRILQDRANLALGFSEYRSTLATVDKPIQTMYTKIMRSAAAKPGKRGKNKASLNASIMDENISAGGIPLQLPPELMERVRLRKRFVDTFGAALKLDDDDEGDGSMNPNGHIAMVHFTNPTLLPQRSIYEGAEEEAEKELGWPFRPVAAGVVELPGGSGSAVNGTNGVST
ncbi:Transcriptional regulator [Ceratobasidium sp. 423]|nr:Transcriptional regulator [Ceratobasidium sp. 423]